eukprot:m.917476 g.917476  ORF g.917476 m.917476 type:complete len:158 (-) comp23738_c0_seq67:223-696(-)
MLSPLPHLRWVSSRLNSCGITPVGCVALASALEKIQSVTRVELEQNAVGDEGARALAKMLTANTSITALNVGCNTIGDVGATALADALLVNTTLTAVAVNNNAIGDIGAQALAEVGGQHFNILDNPFGSHGGKVIADALKTNTTIRTLVGRSPPSTQ